MKNLTVIFVSVFVLVLATCGSVASAEVVASHAGPTTFDGQYPADIVILDDVSIGLEGTVEFEFKTDNTEWSATMWHLGGPAWTDHGPNI